MSILLFFLVIFVLILVHEWGHFIVAKMTGMRVDEFAIGFPPRLFKKRWHGTDYTLNALPIGGFVKIAGENAEDVAEDGSVPEDSFVAKSKWAQAAVLIAGVTMNVLFAWFLFVLVFMHGVPSAVDENSATNDAVLAVTQVFADTPAAEAGLPVGSYIQTLSVGDELQKNLTPHSFQTFVSEHQDADITVTYTQGKEGDTHTLVLTPKRGLFPEEKDKPAVGIALSLVESVKLSFVDAVVEATKMTIHSIEAITKGLFTLAKDSIQGDANFSEVSGPIGIVSLVGDAAQVGVMALLMFTAIISLNLAVINLLPFPALDGGRLLMVAIEAITRRPINPVWVGRINALGFILLLLLMLAVSYNDVLKLL